MAGARPRRCKRSPLWTREQGRQHLEAQAASGLSVQDYCFAYGLAPHTFHNWRRRLGEKAENPVAEASASKGPLRPSFAELVVASPECVPEPSVVEVVLGGARRLRVGPGFDEETVRRLVGLLESLPC